MPSLSDAVLDAALSYISTNCVEANVKDASAVLVDGLTINSGNFGAITSGSSGGRKIQCLVSDSNDMKSVSVSTGGSADTVALLDASAAIHVVASISGSDVTLTSTDLVNLGTFSVTIADPT